MQKRKLGKSNLEVLAIGFGCMGLNFSYGHALSKEESITLVRQAVDRGHQRRGDRSRAGEDPGQPP
jgi:aryl-alcohol dehydrogenase-like predicted oxidoreductase